MFIHGRSDARKRPFLVAIRHFPPGQESILMDGAHQRGLDRAARRHRLRHRQAQRHQRRGCCPPVPRLLAQLCRHFCAPGLQGLHHRRVLRGRVLPLHRRCHDQSQRHAVLQHDGHADLRPRHRRGLDAGGGARHGSHQRLAGPVPVQRDLPGGPAGEGCQVRPDRVYDQWAELSAQRSPLIGVAGREG